MVQGVNLNQPATLSWRPDDLPEDTPRSGYARRVLLLRDAINFVKIRLNDEERRTAQIQIDAPPYLLDYSEPGLRQEVKDGLGINIDVILAIKSDHDAQIVITLPGTGYKAVYRLDPNSPDPVRVFHNVKEEDAPIRLEEFLARAHAEAVDYFRRSS